jgi:DNA-binding transcriptional ArsR family regulator
MQQNHAKKKGGKTMAKRPKLTVEEIAEALRPSGGIISHAAESLGVHRSTISRRIARSEKLKAVLEDAKETALDIAESQLIELIKDGNLGAICFFLKCQGKHRGYVERQKIDANIGMTHDDWVKRLDELE